jgi:hypothetical protein
MRSIRVPLELTVRLAADAEVVELLIVLHFKFKAGLTKRACCAGGLLFNCLFEA